MNFRIKVIFHYVSAGNSVSSQKSLEIGVAVCRSGRYQSIELLMHD